MKPHFVVLIAFIAFLVGIAFSESLYQRVLKRQRVTFIGNRVEGISADQLGISSVDTSDVIVRDNAFPYNAVLVYSKGGRAIGSDGRCWIAQQNGVVGRRLEEGIYWKVDPNWRTP